ncbi:hypothetical protein, partial [Klebsiella pneumoniae]|uniref:hypothetical protein n=1 Tax=Klebsiella pneumoniae TaxID=573 RepID=UPI0011579007
MKKIYPSAYSPYQKGGGKTGSFTLDIITIIGAFNMHEDFESRLAVYTDKDYLLESDAFNLSDEQYKRALKMYFDLKYIYHDEHKAINKLTDILYQRCFFYIKANAELDVNRDSLFDVYTDFFVEQGIIKRMYD